MTTQERQLIQSALELLHRAIGLDDAAKAFKPLLRFADERTFPGRSDMDTTTSPGEEKTPLAQQPQGANFLQETTDVGETSAEEQGFVEFTDKEILQMPQKFRKMIIVNRKRCRMRKHPSGNGYTYEIRYRHEGYNISACGKTIELAKANMLKKMRNAMPTNARTTEIPTTLEDFALYYFERFRRPKIAELTYKNDVRRLKRHILPALGKKKLAKITPADCEDLIESMKAAGKGKTADELRSLLSIIFKGAIAHNIIERNPLDIVPHVQHVTKHGKALSAEEIEALFARIRGTKFEIVYALALYTGLRPNELKTATVKNGMIIAVNSKQKKKETVYKRIPICKRLAAYLDKIGGNLEKVHFFCEQYYSVRFPGFCPGHKLYDLRTTFYSRCKELGVAEPALKAYMGHSNGKLGNSYTDLSNEYLLKEGKKLDNW